MGFVRVSWDIKNNIKHASEIRPAHYLKAISGEKFVETLDIK